jgi:MerR family transcriptional regulator/heat shock protein HspR
MQNRYALSTYIDVTVACRLADVSPSTIRRYIELGLVNGVLTVDDLVTLRRVRRLRSLGVNLAGVEIILRMRQQIEDLRSEVARLKGMTPGNLS